MVAPRRTDSNFFTFDARLTADFGSDDSGEFLDRHISAANEPFQATSGEPPPSYDTDNRVASTATQDDLPCFDDSLEPPDYDEALDTPYSPIEMGVLGRARAQAFASQVGLTTRVNLPPRDTANFGSWGTLNRGGRQAQQSFFPPSDQTLHGTTRQAVDQANAQNRQTSLNTEQGSLTAPESEHPQRRRFGLFNLGGNAPTGRSAPQTVNSPMVRRNAQLGLSYIADETSRCTSPTGSASSDDDSSPEQA